MSLIRFLVTKGSTSKLVALLAESNKDICVVTDLSAENEFVYSIDVSMCFSKKDVASWIDTFSPRKLVVDNSHDIDKISLAAIIDAAKEKSVHVDFYGRRTGDDGMLTDSSEYLFTHCDEIQTVLL